jgi:hypothetical protein
MVVIAPILLGLMAVQYSSRNEQMITLQGAGGKASQAACEVFQSRMFRRLRLEGTKRIKGLGDP